MTRWALLLLVALVVAGTVQVDLLSSTATTMPLRRMLSDWWRADPGDADGEADR